VQRKVIGHLSHASISANLHRYNLFGNCERKRKSIRQLLAPHQRYINQLAQERDNRIRQRPRYSCRKCNFQLLVVVNVLRNYI